MVLESLYYYSWNPGPELGSSADAADTTPGPDPDGGFNESYWTWPIPGKKVICWMLVLFLLVLIALVGSIALSPSSTRSPVTSHEDGDIRGSGDRGEGVSSELQSLEEEPEKLEVTRDIHPGQIDCPSVQSFDCNHPRLNASRNCISQHLVCNGQVDCVGTGRDEERCIALLSAADSVHRNLLESTLVAPNEGYVLVRVNGYWHPYCSGHWTLAHFEGVCETLGFSSVSQALRHNLTEYHSMAKVTDTAFGHPQLLILDSEPDSEAPGRVVYAEESQWGSCQVAYLKCS